MVVFGCSAHGAGGRVEFGGRLGGVGGGVLLVVVVVVVSVLQGVVVAGLPHSRGGPRRGVRAALGPRRCRRVREGGRAPAPPASPAAAAARVLGAAVPRVVRQRRPVALRRRRFTAQLRRVTIACKTNVKILLRDRISKTIAANLSLGSSLANPEHVTEGEAPSCYLRLSVWNNFYSRYLIFINRHRVSTKISFWFS